MTAEAARPARRWTLLAAALLGVLVTARLGLWQLDRAAQKEALQAQQDERSRMPALDAGELATDGPDGGAPVAAQLQRPAVLQGHWLRPATVFLDNRTMDGRAGFLVVTPLVLDDGRTLLVQRGWTARDPQDRAKLPDVPLDEDRVRLTGRLAPWPSPLLALGAATGGAIRQNLDRDDFARELQRPLLPLTLQLTAPPLPVSATGSQQDDGLLRHWWVPTADVSKHYGYAVQWFALAALIAGLYVWFQLVRPRLRTPRRA